jgi:uncharacterized protein with HEPN domain
MPHDARALLYDAVQACKRIAQFIGGKTLDDYLPDPLLRSAVERQFIIVGEALNRAVRLDPTLRDRVSETQRIVDFRNILVHGYALIQDDAVWAVVEHDLAILHDKVDAILRELGGLDAVRPWAGWSEPGRTAAIL